ncbi:MAG: UDP-N-acetylmuramoyl-L-alanine--D-glutamate ligase [Candidatus Cloacimonetes bacterium]|nr:UDP-N-acetylmuramoyl-L-alanine--D-glutamate ligase [Candidatus Cloacimonadota bacterium]
MDWKDKRVAVIGLARSGLAAARKLKEIGADPFLSDIRSKEELKDIITIISDFEYELGEHSGKILNNKLIIVSPGVPLDIPILEKAREKEIPIWSELEFGFQLVKDTSSKIIAITGSNGKSTTTSLIHHILKESGKNALLAGNIGLPFTSFPIEKGEYDFIVLEVSSFQLDAIERFKPDIAVLLNITPDHLNRYHTFDAYRSSKLRIFENQTENNFAILNYDDDECKQLNKTGLSKKIFFSVKEKVNEKVWFQDDKIWIKSVDMTSHLFSNDLPIRGLHNISNAVASSLVGVLCGLKPDQIIAALKSFKGLEHRLEWVAEIDERIFINDSKATNCVSVEKALTSFDKPINLIMGGSDKNENFSSLISLIKKNVINLIVLGETKTQIVRMFKKFVNTVEVSDLQEAVQTAYKISEPGEYILLSPGCASYDMYNNFEERGKHFKQLVNTIKK